MIRPGTINVAPFTGAWIETHKTGRLSCDYWRRPLHGGVDRNTKPSGMPLIRTSRPLHGGVDRNLVRGKGGSKLVSRPLHGGVDRN